MTNSSIKKLFKTTFEAAQSLKAENVVGLDLTSNESYTDYILSVSGNNERQIQAIANRIVEDAFKKCKVHPLGVEGYETSQWILIDFGDIVCHVFSDEVRDMYHIEDMWPHVSAMDELQLAEFVKSKQTA